jgi:radical SAM protein with 4Fe4S-binding SPASM domain
VHKALKQSLLRYGGYEAARAINARLEYLRLIRRYVRFIGTGSAFLPDRVMFEPTQRCNLRCRMCYQDRRAITASGELTFDQVAAFYDRNPYLRKVTFIGGEIFVRADMLRMIDHLNRSRDIVLCTNGTLVSQAQAEALARLRSVYTVCISLDGPREVHDSIRGIQGSYERATRAIRMIASVLPVTVNMVIQNENLPHVSEVVDACARMGVSKLKIEMERLYSAEKQDAAIAAADLRPGDMPMQAKSHPRGYSAGQLREVLLEAVRQGRRCGVHVCTDPPYLMRHLQACHEDSLLAARRFVCHGITTATVAPNGDVVHCIHIRKTFGNIMEAPLEEIWNSASAGAFRQKLLVNNLTPLCENCPFMSPAPAFLVRRISAMTRCR